MMNMEYKVVDHVFFENGTEMSAPTDENMTRISGIIEKGIKYRGNGHISQTFGMSEQESNDYVASH